MLTSVPLLLSIVFILITLITIGLFYWASHQSKSFLMGAIAWTLLMSVLALIGIYQNTEAVPPRIFVLGILPTFVMMILAFSTKSGRAFIDQLNLERLTYMHTIRIPVEIVLLLLYQYGAMSIYQTFEGANFDILAGLTAPFIAYFGFVKGKLSNRAIWIWNIVCLLLLTNIIIISTLAAPSPFQQIAFDQPNIAISYFPFNLLATVVVPLVFFAHLVAIKRLWKKS